LWVEIWGLGIGVWGMMCRTKNSIRLQGLVFEVSGATLLTGLGLGPKGLGLGLTGSE